MKNPCVSVPPVSRRDFLRGGLALGTGLVVGFHWSSGPAKASRTGVAFAPNAFVRIAPDSTVTVLAKHIEFGQGSYTGLATLVAEELDAAWDQIRVEAAPSNAALYNNFAFGPVQGTGGSTAMANSWQQMRQAGATARALLVRAGAETWGVSASEVTVREGRVLHEASGQSAAFGELAEAASAFEAPQEVTLKDPADFRLIGKKHLPRVDVPSKTDGQATFTQDVQLPGMLTAVIARPPRFGGKVSKVDATEAKKVNGVVDVVQVPSGVAVLAKNTWAAEKGRRALSVEWDESAAEKRGTAQIEAEYRELAGKAGTEVNSDGDVATALGQAEKVIEAEYVFPYLAHAPMEPMDAVARLENGECEVWAGSQIQTIDQGVVAAFTGLPPEKVKIHTLYGGGSFGRRATTDGDVAGEVASVVTAIGGKAPVKLLWTREDDIRGGKYRPFCVHRLRGGIDSAGKITAWEQRVVVQSIVTGTAFEAALVHNGIDHTSVEGANPLPYAIANRRLELHTTEVKVPVLWWRSVGHTHTAYANETFLDELADAAGKDPVELRMELLKEHPRHLGVLKLAAEKAGWGKSLGEGRAFGVAVHESFASFVAQVAEVSIDDYGMPRVHRVVCAVDCGIPINPDNIKAQMEGGLGFGLGTAYYNAIDLEEGRVVQSNFHDYRSLRIGEMPRVEVHIVPSTEPPTGVGEPGVPPIAPSVANGYRRLTGKSIYRLPFDRATEA